MCYGTHMKTAHECNADWEPNFCPARTVISLRMEVDL